MELGFELRTVSCRALAVGEKGGLGGSHSPVRSLKNHGEMERGMLWLNPPSPSSRPGRRPGFLIVLLSLIQNTIRKGEKGTSCSFLPELLVFLVPVGPRAPYLLCAFLSVKWG